MKRPSEEDKIYYDVTIDYQPEHDEKKIGSKAETEIRLKEPLIENPEEYMLGISKFKIDTISLPLFIPEIKQPQNVSDLSNREILTNYQIKVDAEINVKCFEMRKTLDGNKKEADHFWMFYKNPNDNKFYDRISEGEQTFKKEYIANIPLELNKEINFISFVKNSNGSEIKSQVYIDNTQEQLFVYDYSVLLKAINKTLHNIFVNMDNEQLKCFKAAFKNLEYIEEGKMGLFKFKNLFGGEIYNQLFRFKNTLENNIQIREHQIISTKGKKTYGIAEMRRKNIKASSGIYYNEYIYNERIFNIHVYFSKNLLKYIGFGNLKIYDDWWEYNINSSLTTDDYAYGSFEDLNTGTNFMNIKRVNIITFDKNYLTNWNPIKAIIIGSDTLPVTEEYLPVAFKDGFLTHYKTDNYIHALKDMGIEKTEIRDIFKKNGQKILDIFYPVSTTPGDIRSTIIFSRENMEDGQTITLTQSSPIQNFNIWVKWLDTYGNLYDLRLWNGTAIDIRLCFIKKHTSKEDLAEGFSAILDALPKKKEKKELRPNGKPNRIVAEGADNFGLVHF